MKGKIVNFESEKMIYFMWFKFFEYFKIDLQNKKNDCNCYNIEGEDGLRIVYI